MAVKEGISQKHQDFINEYLKCWNATEAYRRVYPNSSYDAAGANAARLIGNDRISAEIQRRIDENAMGVNEVLARLAEHARGDMGDFLDVNGDIALVGTKTRLIKKIKIKTTTRTIGDMDVTTKETDLELYDAQAALEKIGRHHKLFNGDTPTGTKDDPIHLTYIKEIRPSATE